MNRKIACVILLIGIMLVGCATTKEVESVEPEPQAVVEPEVVEEPEPETVPEPEEPEMSDELVELLGKHTKVTKYSYTYKEGTDAFPVEVDGSRQKITYGSMKQHGSFEYYDIYLDSEKRTAFLVCGDMKDCKGRFAMEVDYSDFEIFTPFEAVARVNNGEITEHTQLQNRNSAVISYINEQKNLERMWVWEYWGMPMKREITSGGTKKNIYYDNLVIPATVDVEMPEGLEII